MTMEQLLSVISTAVAASSAQQNQTAFQSFAQSIANAITESRKPLPDPKEEARRQNAEADKKREEEIVRRQKAVRKAIQTACTHIAGSYGDLEDMYHRVSILWHQTDTGVQVGICVGCGRLFAPDDADYSEWRQKKSFCRVMSKSGDRIVYDHKAALEATMSGVRDQ
jgi:hypothetical protein